MLNRALRALYVRVESPATVEREVDGCNTTNWTEVWITPCGVLPVPILHKLIDCPSDHLQLDCGRCGSPKSAEQVEAAQGVGIVVEALEVVDEWPPQTIEFLGLMAEVGRQAGRQAGPLP